MKCAMRSCVAVRKTQKMGGKLFIIPHKLGECFGWKWILRLVVHENLIVDLEFGIEFDLRQDGYPWRENSESGGHVGKVGARRISCIFR